jgi:HK97 family phage major capsid protein
VAPTPQSLLAQAESDRRKAEREHSAARDARKRIEDRAMHPDGVERFMTAEEDAAMERAVEREMNAREAISQAEGRIATCRALIAEEDAYAARAAVNHTAGPPVVSLDARERPVDGGTQSRVYGRDAGDAPGGWTREDGRPACLRRDERTADSPVAQELIARDPARHLTEQHSGIGSLVRSLTTTGASALVPQVWSSSIIDIARRQAQVINAGAETLVMDGKTLNVGRALTDPVSAWIAEGGTRTASDPTYDLVTLTANTMYCFTTATYEWLQDAPNADQIIEEQIGKSMALQWDLTALFGGAITGADGVAAAALGAQASPPSPRGILGDLLANKPANVLGNATNGTVQAIAGFWREILQALYLVKAANEQPTALLWHPKLEAYYNGLVDTLGQPLRRPDVLAALPFLTTGQIPANLTQGTGTNMSDFVVGDFRQVLLGQRLDMTLQVLHERYAEVGLVGFKMEFRGDIRLARPGSMAWWRFIQAVA